MDKFVIKFNSKAIIQYIYIYMMIEFVGGRVYTVIGQAAYGLIIFILGFIFCINHKNITYNDKKIKIYMYIVFWGLSCTAIYTFGNLSIYTVFTTISKFLIVYMAVAKDRIGFLNRFLNLTYILSITSLIIYGITMVIGYEKLAPIYTNLYEIKNGTGWMGSTYGLFLIVFNLMDPTRNAYMFGEPGEYQMLIVVALYLVLFKGNNLEQKKRMKYLIIFLITLLTIQSTTGFISFSVMVLVLLAQSNKIAGKKIKSIFVILFVGLGIYMLVTPQDANFIYKSVFNKILDSSGNIDLTVSTGVARVWPIERYFVWIKESPLKALFGVGYSGLANTSIGEYTTAGIINCFMMFGIINSIIIYSFLISQIIKYTYGKLEILMIIFIIVNMGISQPDLIGVLSILLSLYGMITNTNGYKINDIKEKRSI